MVIGLLAITAIPTVIGVSQAISAQKKQQAAAGKENEKFHLSAIFKDTQEEQGTGILVDNKLYFDLPEAPVKGHKVCGYHFKYPSEEGHLGLVSTTCDDPPALGWIFVNKDTHAVAYGSRKDTIGHVIGPWGWSEDERFVTLQEGYDNFVAVKEDADGGVRWAVYWDPDGKILEEVGQERCRPIQLRRRSQLGMESRYVKD
ncbi:Fc.00g009450.m01.CDS01 [Cosmosporella sp. VM-42]